jgi:uncharacterized protein with beta-barrel porin domain
LTLNVGTTINRGCAPFATPIKSVLGFVIAAAAIEPMLLASVADTLTAGDVACSVARFVKLNVAVTSTSLEIPVDPAVSTSCPLVFNHAPVAARAVVGDDVTVTVKDSAFSVSEPVSPVIVTVEPSARSTFAVSATVMTLFAPDTGVRC